MSNDDLSSIPISGGDPSDPYGFFDRLRSAGSIHRVIVPRIGEAWLISRNRSMSSILVSSLVSRTAPGSIGSIDLRKLRRFVAPFLNMKLVKDISPFVATCAAQLLKDIGSRRSADLVTEFSMPLSCATFARLLGIPIEDKAFVFETASVLSPLASVPDTGNMRKHAITLLKRYFTDLVSTGQKGNGNDLLTLLANSRDAERATPEEIAEIALVLISAGLEPMANLLSSSLLTVIGHSAFFAKIRAKPDNTEAAVEELVRYDSPVFPGVWRYATADLFVENFKIPQGELLLLPVASAGRDPEEYPEPKKLEIDRCPGRGLAFGNGAHYCLGSALAMHVVTSGIRAFAHELPHATFADDLLPTWSDRSVRALLSLPIALRSNCR